MGFAPTENQRLCTAHITGALWISTVPFGGNQNTESGYLSVGYMGSWSISGFNLSAPPRSLAAFQGYWPYSFYVGTSLNVGEMASRAGTTNLTTGRSVYAPNFIVSTGGVRSVEIGGWATADFVGSLTVLNGNLHEFVVRNQMRLAAGSASQNILDISGNIDKVRAMTIGLGGSYSSIRASYIDEVSLRFPPNGEAATLLRSPIPNGTLSIFSELIADQGGIDEIRLDTTDQNGEAIRGDLYGKIQVSGGNLNRVVARSIYRDIVVRRDSSILDRNAGGNIGTIDATDEIRSDLIRADGTIETIKSASIVASTIIMSQAITSAVELTTPFAAQVVLTWGRGANPNNPIFTLSNGNLIPESWKRTFVTNELLLKVRDSEAIYGVFGSGGNGTTGTARQIVLGKNANGILTLQQAQVDSIGNVVSAVLDVGP